MPLAQLAEPWPKMELVQLETEVRRSNSQKQAETSRRFLTNSLLMNPVSVQQLTCRVSLLKLSELQINTSSQ